MNESKELLVAKKTALKAGELLHEMFKEGSNKIQTHKGSNDFATEADYAAQELIFEEIKKDFPQDDFLEEESFDGKIPVAKRLWVIDPLDGTVNFEAGIPEFCVSIALVDSTKEKFSPIVGVVYNPVLKEMFCAENGKGAFLNGKQIFVSKRSLKESLLATSITRTPDKLAAMLTAFNHLSQQVRKFRSIGSTALETCYVACGRFGGFFVVSNKPWDSAAANLIVKEAGGVFSELEGNEWRIGSQSVAVANNEESLNKIIDAFK